jgi:thiopeptide-type bacteriocin biosynthesis protein
MEQEKKWLAAYLYYHEPWEDLLVNALAPFVKEVMETGLADQYFFIRYWEKGPHIRLRFKGNVEVLDKILKPRLEQHFTGYFAEKPSSRPDLEWLKTLPEEHRWYPDNTVQYIPYEPETGRYGGEEAILAAERLFQASSDATLALMASSGAWDYNRSLGAAIQMHLAFAHSMGMSLGEARTFFARIFESWFPRAYQSFQRNLSEEEMAARKEETLRAFHKTYENQKNLLLSFHKTIWEGLEEGVEFEDEWLNRWIASVKSVKQELHGLFDRQQVFIPVFRKGSIDYDSGRALNTKDELWYIYDSYIHMTNNRVGVTNQDEGYLGYLIKESLREITEEAGIGVN